MKKEKIYLILTTIFVILTLVLSGYILAKEGTVNSGYALIPCLFAIIFSNLCIKEKNKNKKLDKKQLKKHNKTTKIIVITIITFIILNIISSIILKDNSNNNLIEITPQIKEKKEITKSVIVDKIDSSYTINYSGIKKATIKLNNEKLDLAESLAEGKITLDKIIEELKKYDELNDGGTEIYRDGGTKKYLTEDYTIIKCNTLDGNKDIYIGDKDMKYEEYFCK